MKSSRIVVTFLLAVLLVPFSLAWGSANPVPQVSSPLQPSAAVPGSAAFTLTVNGAGFIGSSVVRWNQTALVTTFVSASQLTAEVPASAVATAGTALVSVVNPTPGGGTSNPVQFEVTTASSGVAFFKTDYAPGQFPIGEAQADFNGDGIPDLAVSNMGSNTISIFLGNGNGTFQPHVDYAAGIGPWNLAVADFNNDGKLDLAVINSGCPTNGATCSGETVGIYLGNGDGTFQTPALTFPSYDLIFDDFAVGDFNADGKVDLAFSAVGPTGGLAVIYLGNGDGTFTAGNQYSFGPVSSSGVPNIVAEDFNGDGKLDLAISQSSHALNVSNAVVFLGNGDGTFQNAVTYATAAGAGVIAAGDFNGDGIPDLATLSTWPGSNTFSILLGNGDGTFQPHVDYATGNEPVSLTVADLNGDGKLDLAIPEYNDNTVSVMLGNGDGTFEQKQDFPVGSGPGGIVAADFNGDGRMDIAEADYLSNNVSVLLQVAAGPQPSASLSESTLTFANQAVGSTSGSQTVKLHNTGAAALTITSIAASGDFAQQNTCGATLAVGANCTISITFTPTSAGSLSGALTILDDNHGLAGSVQSVTLGGTGTAPIVSLADSVTFAAELVGTTSSAQTITLTNAGTASLVFSAAPEASGPFAIAASGTTCSTASPVLPSATCTVAVTFTPTAGGPAAGSVSFSDNAPASPQGVALIGAGEDFTFAPGSGSSTSSTVSPGQTASYTLSLGGQGGISGTVAFSCSGAPVEATCAASPNPATLGNSATNVTVTAKTTAASLISPRSRRLPPAYPEGQGGRRLLLMALVLLAMMAWAAKRRKQLGLRSSRTNVVLLASGLLLVLGLAGCGGGGGGGPVGPPANTGTPAGTYTLTVTGTTGSGASAVSHNLTLTLIVS